MVAAASHLALDPRTPPMELLSVIGPESERSGAGCEPIGVEQAVAYCRGLATSHYENFSVLSSLVPERLQDDFAAVYAFCRWADDLGDETGNSPEARARSEELLGWWRRELRECFGSSGTGVPPVILEGAGQEGVEVCAPKVEEGCVASLPNAQAGRLCHPDQVRHPVFIALRQTRSRHPALTIKPFEDLIDAFVQDQRVTRYQTWEQAVDYCTRSANPVGRIVLALGGYAETPANAERYAMSDATCSALQLVNFWQDVRRDLLERDRVYIPEETGVTAAMLRAWADRPNDPGARVPFIRAMRPLVDRTEELFAQGRPLPQALDSGLAPVVWLFGAGGEAILSAVRGIGCATLWERPSLSKAGKALLVGRAWMWSRFGGGGRGG